MLFAISNILPVSQICALMVFASTWMLRVVNSTPMVDFDSRLNSFLVKRETRLDFPTPESPIRTTKEHNTEMTRELLVMANSSLR